MGIRRQEPVRPERRRAHGQPGDAQRPPAPSSRPRRQHGPRDPHAQGKRRQRLRRRIKLELRVRNAHRQPDPRRADRRPRARVARPPPPPPSPARPPRPRRPQMQRPSPGQREGQMKERQPAETPPEQPRARQQTQQPHHARQPQFPSQRPHRPAAQTRQRREQPRHGHESARQFQRGVCDRYVGEIRPRHGPVRQDQRGQRRQGHRPRHVAHAYPPRRTVRAMDRFQ